MGPTTIAKHAIKTAIASFVRPADTTPYAAGDVIADSTSAATVLKFAGMAGGEAGGVGIIRHAVLEDEANLATKLNAELYLFSSPPAAYGNDNGAFALTVADLRNLLGVITFAGAGALITNAGVDAAGNCAIITGGLSIPFRLPAAAGAVSGCDIYGILVARNAYTPVSAERFNVLLSAEL